MIIDIDIPKPCTVELDADSLVYRIAGAVDMLGEGKDFAKRFTDSTIQNIYDDTGCNKCNIYLGTSENYRNNYATLFGYKDNRKSTKRPEYYDAVRAYLVTEHDAKLVYGEEAEDAVGIACYFHQSYDDYMVGAIDKDLQMIAGHHYNYSQRKLYFVDKYEAMRAFYIQLVSGDKSVDNIPGLYHLLLLDGLEEQAHKFRHSRYKSKLKKQLCDIKKECEMWDAVVKIYESHGELDRHGFSRIIEIGVLLWIRRYSNEIWIPPTNRDFDYIELDKR